NTCKVEKFARAIGNFAEKQDCAGLRHCLDDNHAGQHRSAGKVPLKERLIDRYVFYRHNPLQWLNLDDTINQQEWITMRNNRLNLVDVHGVLSTDGEQLRTGLRCPF